MANDQAHQKVWLARLCSALRTTLACIIVGCTTLYGPAPIQHLIAYPAFAYLTTILIVSNATLGDALRGCWHAFYASIQVIPLSMLTLRMVGPPQFTINLAALAVAAGSFAVALPESTHLMSKRIAFGQLVVVYVGAVVKGAETDVVMHPLSVASSTALGALASILVMLFPYPRLAYCQMTKACKLYAENASERLNLYVKALSAKDNALAQDFISRSVFLTQKGSRLLQSIKSFKDGMFWEIPHMRFLKSKVLNTGAELENIEAQIRGMEVSLSSCTFFPVGILDQSMTDVLESMKAQSNLRLEQVKSSLSYNTSTAPETKEVVTDEYFQNLKTMPRNPEDLPVFFFLYCMRLLQDSSSTSLPVKEKVNKTLWTESCNSQDQAMDCLKWFSTTTLEGEKLLFSLKCSISLGLAVLFGLMFNIQNGYWSGLTIATSFVNGRQALFTLSNARAQGTAMGSVYGVLCAYIFQRLGNLKLLALIPWIIFTSFLGHSRMYGQPGAISAVIGALLILGRRNYGTPTEFAITRITEACIGLICGILVEIIFNPTRAASLAKFELSRCLKTLGDCIEGMALSDKEEVTNSSREKLQSLKSEIVKFKEVTAEAETEPNFWFLPFNSACYNKVLGSLSRMTDVLVSAISMLEFLSRVSRELKFLGEELKGDIHDDLELFKCEVGSLFKCLEQVTLIKSLALLERESTDKDISHDIESGVSIDTDGFKVLNADEREIMKTLDSLLRHLNQVVDKIQASEADEKLKGLIVHTLSGLGFCIGTLMKDTMYIEKEIKNLLQWENPSSHVDLREISRKIDALYAKSSYKHS